MKKCSIRLIYFESLMRKTEIISANKCHLKLWYVIFWQLTIIVTLKIGITIFGGNFENDYLFNFDLKDIN